jgi:hypothetical protein
MGAITRFEQRACGRAISSPSPAGSEARLITVAPRLIAGLGIRPRDLPCGEVWGDTRIELPFVAGGTELVDAITGMAHRVENGGIRVAHLLHAASVAVLT